MMGAGVVEGVVEGVVLLVLLAVGEGLHGSTRMLSGVPVPVSTGAVFISPHDAVVVGVVGGASDRAEVCRLPARRRGAPAPAVARAMLVAGLGAEGAALAVRRRPAWLETLLLERGLEDRNDVFVRARLHCRRAFACRVPGAF